MSRHPSSPLGPWGIALLALALGDAQARTEPAFAPCPATPNCVSTEAPATDTVHALPPLPLPPDLDPVAALDAFEAIVRSARRTDVLTREALALHAIDRSLVFRFVDDVHARVDPVARVLHARSASRVGGGDLGVNRRRLTGWFTELAEAWRVDWPETP